MSDSNIPDYVRNNLPSPNISINQFLAISLPPRTSVTARLMRVEKYLSEEPPNIHNVNNVKELMPPPADVVLALKCHLRVQNNSATYKHSYHEDVVTEVLEQLNTSVSPIIVDTRLPKLRDQSTRWIWNAYETINKDILVKKVKLEL